MALFTRAEARAAGIPIRTLTGPRFQKIFYDVYVASSVQLTTALRARAALHVAGPGTYASHFTAAELWGGCVPDSPLTHIGVPHGNRSERRGIAAHAAPSDAETTAVNGIAVATPEQTFLDLAGEMSLVELVVLGDSLVRHRRTTTDALIDASSSFRGRGARLARRAAKLVRAGVDSPMESRLRLLLVLAGLPEPTVNYIVRDQDGQPMLRFDLSYPELKLIIEYDGRQHARDDTQWSRDIARREELDGLGWRLIVVRAEDIYTRPDSTLARVVEAMRSRGQAHPLRLRAEWRQYFPVRRAAA